MSDDLTRDDRQDITELLVRYATGIDRRDWELFRSCFTDDCHADYGAIGVWRGADEITEWMRDTHEPVGHTMHRLTNHSMLRDGDRVSARSYVDALVLFADNQTGTRASGFYDDELVLTDAGWRICNRRYTMVLLQLVPDGTVLNLDELL